MSLFLDENKVLRKAFNDSNNIIITDYSGRTVNGALQEMLQFSVEADWENIFSVSERFQSAKALVGAAGLGIFNAGLWTKKFYKGGSYLKITPKIRIVDWEDNGIVLEAAETLLDMALPVYDGKLDQKFRELLRNASKNVEQDGAIVASINGIVAVGKAGLQEAAELFNGEFARKADSLIYKNEVLSNSPRSVNVTISNFYQNEFIIESVQVQFSKEMTDSGPLYVDIDMSMTTPMVTTRGGTGISSIKGKKPRFINAG